MSTIGFVGPFGDTNFGDYAMMVNDVLSIKSDENIIFTYNYDFTVKIVNKYMQHMKAEVFEIKSKLPTYTPVSGKDFMVEYKTLTDTAEEVVDSVYENEIKNVLNRVDKIVVCGGGYMNFLWCSQHRRKRLYQILAPILIAAEMNIPITFLSNTFGPWEQYFDFFSSIFSKLHNSVFAVRDRDSIKQFEKIKPGFNSYLLPDDLYFIQDELLSEQKCSMPDHYVVLELYCSMKQIEEELDTLRSVVQYFRIQQGWEVVFLPFDAYYGGVNQGKFIKEAIPEVILYPLEEYLPIEACNEIISHAKFVMCNRYHALLMAIRSGVPCHMYSRCVNGNKDYYSSKINGLLDVLGELTEEERNLFYEMDFHEFLNNGKTCGERIAEQKRLFERKESVEKQWKNIREDYMDCQIKI